MMNNTSDETKAAASTSLENSKTSPRGVATSSSEFVDHEAIKDEASRQLKALLQDMSAPFCCGGTVVLPDTSTVTMFLDSAENSQGKVPVTVVIEPPYEEFSLSGKDEEQLSRKRYALDEAAIKKQPQALSKLLDNAPPAMFGKGNETVHDESVRSAKQVPAEDFEVNIPPQVLDGIRDSIQSSLNIQTDIFLEPYSLNLYEKGGKFLKHKDTPRGKDMIGTLVICLPSRFWGGMLIVTKGSGSEDFFHSGHREWRFCGIGRDEIDRNEINPKVMPWCAFFSDVDHEIKKVDDGVRVTIAYNIRQKNGDSADPLTPRSLPGDSKQKMSALVGALRDLLVSDKLLPDGGKLGFACEHLYTNNQIFPKNVTSKDALADNAIKKLKGRDLLLAQAASEANLKVYILPFLCAKSNDYACGFQNDGEFQYLDKFLPPNMKNFDADDYGCVESNDAVADLWVVDPMEKCCESQFVGENEYWGNSGMETDNYYVRAVLLIELPPSHERAENETKKARRSSGGST